MPSVQTPTKKPTGSRRSAARRTLSAAHLGDLQANAHEASELLKALAHEGRLVILCQLVEGEKSVSELAHLLKMRQPAVSQRLARLREDGLVKPRRNGKSVYYALAGSNVRQVVTALEKAFCR